MTEKGKVITSMDELQIMVMEPMCPGYWGKAPTLEEALRNAHNPEKYLVLLVHKDATVDPRGWTSRIPLSFQPREIIRKGVPRKKAEGK